ncbi:MAG: 50S ribosomal protein L18 [Microgenomates group bacterium]
MITKNRTQKRQNRVRAKIAKNIGIPRLTVLRTNSHMWVQVIDDKHGKTLASSSSKTIKATGSKTEVAIQVGTDIAKKSLAKKILNIRFDRGGYKYHGRVKALADAARDGGLKF